MDQIHQNTVIRVLHYIDHYSYVYYSVPSRCIDTYLVTRQSISVIQAGVVYVGVPISRCYREQLVWVADKLL